MALKSIHFHHHHVLLLLLLLLLMMMVRSEKRWSWLAGT
jgi:hypothetical protein